MRAQFSPGTTHLLPVFVAKAVLVVVPILFSTCTEPREIPYTPVVVFNGQFGDDRVELTGNGRYPNECYLVDDTLRMRFFSPDYNVQDNIWYGDQLRIDLYPDTVITDSNQLAMIGYVNAFVRLSRYLDGNFPNETYRVGPSDSSFIPPLGISMQVEKRGNRTGASIHVTNIWAGMHREGKNGYADMVIDSGTITGAIGTKPER